MSYRFSLYEKWSLACNVFSISLVCVHKQNNYFVCFIIALNKDYCFYLLITKKTIENEETTDFRYSTNIRIIANCD